jgi:hypothetical protein
VNLPSVLIGHFGVALAGWLFVARGARIDRHRRVRRIPGG